MKKIIKLFWELFNSVKFTIVLLILITIFSIIGTILLQKPLESISPAIRYKDTLPQFVINILDLLGLFDLYHSKWFIFLLGLIIINLIVCSIDRLPKTIKKIKRKTIFHDEIITSSNKLEHASLKLKTNKINYEELYKIIHNYFHSTKLFYSGSVFVILCILEFVFFKFKTNLFWAISLNFFGLIYIFLSIYIYKKKPEISTSTNSTNIFYQWGRFSRLGVYITHVSIIIILIGGFIGALWGVEGMLNLAEGETKGSIITRKNTLLPLGFQVKCDDFDIEYYPNTERPKEFTSVLKIIDHGNEVLTKKIEVNDPLEYKGIYFYQSSYDKSGIGGIELAIINKSKNNEKNIINLASDNLTYNIEKDKKLEVVDYYENLHDFGPAIRLNLTGEEPFWIFKNYPNFDCKEKDHKGLCFQFLNLEERYVTGLSVAHDPGVLIVWTGCVLLIFGLIICFFYSQKRIWIKIEGAELKIAAHCNRNKLGFKSEFERLVNTIKNTYNP
jgi:cytochrome c biogenesis protein